MKYAYFLTHEYYYRQKVVDLMLQNCGLTWVTATELYCSLMGDVDYEVECENPPLNAV